MLGVVESLRNHHFRHFSFPIISSARPTVPVRLRTLPCCADPRPSSSMVQRRRRYPRSPSIFQNSVCPQWPTSQTKGLPLEKSRTGSLGREPPEALNGRTSPGLPRRALLGRRHTATGLHTKATCVCGESDWRLRCVGFSTPMIATLSAECQISKGETSPSMIIGILMPFTIRILCATVFHLTFFHFECIGRKSPRKFWSLADLSLNLRNVTPPVLGFITSFSTCIGRTRSLLNNLRLRARSTRGRLTE